MLTALFRYISSSKKSMHAGQIPFEKTAGVIISVVVGNETSVKEIYPDLRNYIVSVIKPVYLELC